MFFFLYDKNGHRCIVEKKWNGEKNSILKSVHAHGNGKSYFCINRIRKTFETEMNLHHISNDSMNSISGRWWNLFPLKIQLNCYWFFILSPSIEKKIEMRNVKIGSIRCVFYFFLVWPFFLLAHKLFLTHSVRVFCYGTGQHFI